MISRSQQPATVIRESSSVLVTGGAGFVGASVVPALAADGWRVRVFDNGTSSVAGALDHVDCERIHGDVRDVEAVARAVDGVGAVVHLAAQSGVSASVVDPHADASINIGGTLNVLDASRRAGVRRVVVASSTAPVAGAPPPVDEGTRPAPLSPYGASKLAAEAYAAAFHKTYGLSTVSLRFANIYGPWSTRKTSVVASFVRDALTSGTMTIYGDGTQTRDMVHVSDVARAVVAALAHPEVAGEALHISSGVEVSVRDLADLVRRALGRDGVTIRHEAPRPGDAFRVWANPQRAGAVLGWRPSTELASGITATCRWFLSQVAVP